MKKLILIVASFQFFVCHTFGQEIFQSDIMNEGISEIINYENKLRIKFPLSADGFHLYRNKTPEKLAFEKKATIQELKDYISFILFNAPEISYEVEKNEPLLIDFIRQNDLTQMRITKNQTPINYLYKDTTLIFTGMHVIRLFSTKLQTPIAIYFDFAEDLQDLSLIPFDSIYSEIENIYGSGDVKLRPNITRTVLFNYFDGKTEFAGLSELPVKNEFGMLTSSYLTASPRGIDFGLGIGPVFSRSVMLENKRKSLYSFGLEYTLSGLKTQPTHHFGLYADRGLLSGEIGGYFSQKNESFEADKGVYFDLRIKYKYVFLGLRNYLPAQQGKTSPSLFFTCGIVPYWFW